MANPPPIRVGVEGIAPAPTPARAERIDWTRLIGLPPFQMYAINRGGIPADNIMDRIGDWVRSHDDTALYADYCEWHAMKGCWTNETPDGRLLDGRQKEG